MIVVVAASVEEKHRDIFGVKGTMVGATATRPVGKELHLALYIFKNFRPGIGCSVAANTDAPAGIVAADHIHVSHEVDLIQREGRIIHEVPRTLQAQFFGPEGDEEKITRLLRAVLREIASQFQQTSYTRGIIIGPIVDLSFGFRGFGTPLPTQSQMVKMRSYDDGVGSVVIQKAQDVAS